MERRARGLGWPREKELFPPASNLVTRWKGGFPRLAATMHTEGRIARTHHHYREPFFSFPLLAREPTIFTPFEKYRGFRRDEGSRRKRSYTPYSTRFTPRRGPLAALCVVARWQLFYFPCKGKKKRCGWRMVFISTNNFHPLPLFFFTILRVLLCSRNTWDNF